jgi:transposase-like protein
MVNQTDEVQPEPTLERRTRRQLSSAEKQRLLAEHDALAKGEKSAWLRRQGLYASQLANWRKTLTEQGTRRLEPSAGGRKAKDSRDRRIEQLEKEKVELEQRARVAEDLVELQKNWPSCPRTSAAGARDELLGAAPRACPAQPRL